MRDRPIKQMVSSAPVASFRTMMGPSTLYFMAEVRGFGAIQECRDVQFCMDLSDSMPNFFASRVRQPGRVPERTRTIKRVSNGEINRGPAILKRIFNLALQAGKIRHKPHVPLLREDNS